jgi:hypothetical protein
LERNPIYFKGLRADRFEQVKAEVFCGNSFLHEKEERLFFDCQPPGSPEKCSSNVSFFWSATFCYGSPANENAAANLSKRPRMGTVRLASLLTVYGSMDRKAFGLNNKPSEAAPQTNEL